MVWMAKGSSIWDQVLLMVCEEMRPIIGFGFFSGGSGIVTKATKFIY
jgi:hypothetical protein